MMKKIFTYLVLSGFAYNAMSQIGYVTNFASKAEDTDNSGTIDTQDVLKVYEAIKNSSLSYKFDVNSDGNTDSQDVLKIYEYMKNGVSLEYEIPSMKIIDNAISVLNYDAILNTEFLKVNIFMSLDNGMLTYVDPVSMGQSVTHIWEFNYNESGTNQYAKITANIYEAEMQEDGSWIKTNFVKTIKGSSRTDQIYNRLKDILENCVVIGDITSDKKYYKTIGNNFIKIEGQIDKEEQMTVCSGNDLDIESTQTVSSIYNMPNGKLYIINHPLYTSYLSVADQLAGSLAIIDEKGEPEFHKFYNMLCVCALSKNTNKNVNWSSASKIGNLIYIPDNSSESVNYLLNSYNYTMYIPTNKAMDEAFAKGLPTLEMLNAAIEAGNSEEAAQIKKVMLDFVKYHIQDNAIFVGQDFEEGAYETAKINPLTGVSFKLYVSPSTSGLTVKGVCSEAQEINKYPLYNKIAREYWLNNYKSESATLLETSSSVVMHAIDHPLLYKYIEDGDLSLPENNQFIYSADDVYTKNY